MKFPRIARAVPSWKNALLAVLSALLLILAFPDFELWFLAWFALIPLLIAVEREKESTTGAFFLGWLWGVFFFFGTCWWLTYAPIHYAAFPWPIAYFLLFCVVAVVGVFPGFFATVTSIFLRRFGLWGILSAPCVWVTAEFARYWITGNNWNAIGYSQASFIPFALPSSIGGVYLVGFLAAAGSSLLVFEGIETVRGKNRSKVYPKARFLLFLLILAIPLYLQTQRPFEYADNRAETGVNVVGIQPNVPMSGLDPEKWTELRDRQIALAEKVISAERARGKSDKQNSSTTVILPESPMNFQWDEDADFQKYISEFAAKNDVNVLFNSSEPDRENNKYFNSAVMVDPTGREVAEYDKIYLLPFGEAVPTPLENILPGFVGNFSYGRNYSLVPLGDAKAGIMICFESHFGQLSREYVRRGADAIIEMTNDGYLGPTPVLRQHLANAVFRAIETNRPVLRVTNVGITAYITERGEVLDATRPYTEDTRVWPVAKSDGGQTFYVKYGDWFAWLCVAVTLLMLVIAFVRRNDLAVEAGTYQK